MDNKDQYTKLFAEFPPVSTTEWEEKILIDLKGADYNKRLIWKTDEGISVKPYYRAEDLQNTKFKGYREIRKSENRGNNDWVVRQDISAQDLKTANKIAVDAINKGAGGIGFCANNITTHKEINHLLTGIDLSKTMINFISSRSYPLTLELFNYEVSSRGYDPGSVLGSLNFDPISYLLLHGDFYGSMESNFEEAEYLINTVQKRVPSLKTITVNGHYFGNAGSTIVQELAFSIASANEYLYELTKKGFTVDAIARKMMLSFSIGSNYFFEIAKLGAARLLWARLVEQYLPQDQASLNIFIHSTTSSWNKTIYDPYVNMLRTTTEGISAVLGNTDSLTVLPFSFPYKEDDEFSTRIARNQQLIIREEAYLAKVVDPASGSYYIENLTDSIAVNAWNIFRQVEEKGGLIECIKSGFIQDEIEASNKKKINDIAERKMVMIGTNQYPNPGEIMSGQISVKEKKADHEGSETKYRKLKITRGSLVFEKIRLDTESFVQKGNKQPSVFLFNIGNPAMRKARATFATNFFGCAGFRIMDNPGFDSLEEGIRTALKSGADILVICSSDEEYSSVVPAICSGIKKENSKIKLVVAGFPKEMAEKFKKDGIDEFIHVRSNVVESLQRFQKLLGIE